MSSEKITKCDRCGRDISLSGKRLFTTLKYFKCIIRNVNFIDLLIDKKELDFCEDCYIEFKKWIKAGEHNE